MATVSPARVSEVSIPVLGKEGSRLCLPGRLTVPQSSRGLVLFAHGSGSSRFSPRNTFVANVLQEVQIGTLLFDLLTELESADRINVFDVDLLADRLLAAIRYVVANDESARLPIGLFGASTGAAAALVAAAVEPRVAAVVSRGGRTDLAAAWVKRVHCPTLLLVGEHDGETLQANRHTYEQLSCEKQLEQVRGATHLFEEPGALEEVALVASEWFARHLRPAATG